MPSTRGSERKNPRDGASWLSTIFFWWMNDLLRLGNNRPLTGDDLFPLLESYKAEVVVRKAEKCWLDELKRSQSENKKPRLWKAMLRLIPWKSAVIMIVLRTFWALSFAFQPVCLWLVLKTLNDKSHVDMKFAIMSVALLGTTTLVKVLSTHHYDYLTELWRLRLKVALIGLVYKKILSLKRYSLEATLSGNTINLVSNDAQKVERSLNQLGMVLAAPLELTISLAILWYLIGWDALAGATIFFVLVTFQMLMARKAAKLRDKAATFTDKRLVVMNEIISGIRAVKMHAWEWNFRDAVCDLRRIEMAIIRFKGLIFSLLVVLFYTTLPIAVLISVATLALTGTRLSSFTIFTLLLGLDTIKFAFCNSLSMSVYNVADAKVALDRIQFFLRDKEPEFGKDNQRQTERLPSTEPLNVDDYLFLQGKRCTEIERTALFSDLRERSDSANLIPDTFANSSSVSTGANSASSGNTYRVPPVDRSMAHVTTGLIASPETSIKEPFVSISKVSCSWNQDSLTDTLTLKNVTLNVCKGEILAITGPVGSGKSSLLTAVLGEIPVHEGTISYYGKVAYVPQIPWVFSGTVRENILFGLPFNEEKFQQIVGICGLTMDLAVFSNRDLTEIGQRGATLSGGQKARVGLARAVYSNADIYLLDDPLSAVDTKVGRNLFRDCILNYLSGHIRLLVTHQLQFLKDLDNIAVMKNGTIAHQGEYSELADQGVFSGMFSQRFEDEPVRARSVSLFEFNKRVTLMQKPRAATTTSHEIRQDIELQTLLEEDITSGVSVGLMKGESAPMSTCSRDRSPVGECDGPVADDRPVLDLKEEEEIKTTGSVTWRLYWDYFKAGLPVPLIILLAVVLIVAQVFLVGPNWWLSRMAKMPHDQQKAPVTQGIYTSIVAVSIAVMAASCFFFYFLLLNAAENLHNKMTISAIKAPVLFYDSNPAGRILNRFSKDVGCMDDELPPLFLQALTTCLASLCAILVPAATNYWLFLALLPILGTVAFYSRYYLKSSRELKRIEAVKCSPVYSHITETVNSCVFLRRQAWPSVRISNMSRTFLERLQRYQDENTQAFFMVVSCNRWLALRIDILCSVFVITVAVTAILIGENSVLAGLALTYALQTLDATQYGVRIATQVENLMTSVERVMAYTKIDSELGYSTPSLPPGSWPSEGRLELQNLSLVYFDGGPLILKNINVCISSKEKVGVVGRTGAGKSSLVSALFRMPDPLGKVLIDGVDINSINLQEARKSMAVITQDPVLFGGTLKRNMDPFSQYTDQELWTALGEVQLKTLVEGLPGKLQFKLKECGTNLSVGERQLVCLARALVQKSKIIIMDEATANVDFKTDRLIQEVIRDKFKDSTVITIAHRLNTILDYDKLLVLDGGRVAEFDKPEVLIRNGGLFSEMVKSQNQSEKCSN